MQACTCPGIYQAAVGMSSCQGRAHVRWPWQKMWIQKQEKHIWNWWLFSKPLGPIYQLSAAYTSRWSVCDTAPLLSCIQIDCCSLTAAQSRYTSDHLHYTRQLRRSSTWPQQCLRRARREDCPKVRGPAPPAGPGFFSGAGGGLWSAFWCLPAPRGPEEDPSGRPQSEPADWGRPGGAACTVAPRTAQNLLPSATGPPAYSSRHSHHLPTVPCCCRNKHC